MRRSGWWTGTLCALAVVAAGCGGADEPVMTAPNVAEAAVSEPAPLEPTPPVNPLEKHRAILTSLARWDAASPGARATAATAVGQSIDGMRYAGMKRFECGGQSHEVGIFTHAATGLEFSLVPGGTFRMGSPDTEAGRESEELVHRVTLSNAFLLARTEVTQAAWKKVMGTNPSKFKGDELPVENVTWKECDEFGEQAGLSIPTEAQWEYACRAGATTAYCFGDDPKRLPEYAWFKQSDIKELESTQKVGRKKPNAFGLHDVHGNVWEWCSDWKDDYPLAPVVDPGGPGNPRRYRVVRGGGWHYPAKGARCAFRTGHAQRARSSLRGLRPILNVWID